jgi:hypothetical protein
VKLELEDVRRLDIKPGQILVATVPDHTTIQQAEQIRDHLRTELPDIKVMVVSHNLELMVLNPQELTDLVLDSPTE